MKEHGPEGHFKFGWKTVTTIMGNCGDSTKKLESRASIQQSHFWVHSQMTGRPYAKGISVHPCPHSCPTSQIIESTVYW